MVYQRETKRITSTKIKQTLEFTSAKKNKTLQCKDGFLLILMRLRLGLFNEDLADRFCIFASYYSNTFKTWIRLFSKTVGKLVAWLPRESVMGTILKILKQLVTENYDAWLLL